MNTIAVPFSLSTPAAFAAALVKVAPTALELEHFVAQGLSFLSPRGRANLFRKPAVTRLTDGTEEVLAMERILSGSFMATDEDAVAIIAAGLEVHPWNLFEETRHDLLRDLMEAIAAAAPAFIEEVVKDTASGRYEFTLANLAGDEVVAAA